MSESLADTPTQLTWPRGYVIALLSAVILATTAIFIRYLTETYSIPALVLAFWRDVFVVLALLLILRVWQTSLLGVKREHIGFLAAFGFALATFNALWTLSVAIIGASLATVLTYTSVGFSALFGWLLLKEYLGWAKLLAISICLIGVVLVSGIVDLQELPAALPGFMAGVLSGLLYAIYSLLGRMAAQRDLNPWTTLLYTFGFASIYLLLINLLPGDLFPGTARRLVDFFWLGTAWRGWFILILLAAGPTLLGFGLYNVSLVYLPASVANLVVTLEPAFTAFFAYYLLGELLTRRQLVGSLLILSGVLVLRVFEMAPKRNAGPAGHVISPGGQDAPELP